MILPIALSPCDAGFFWPIFPVVLWGIGVIFHAQDVYSHREISEEEIRREMERMR